MNQEDKQLLLIDLSARLSYGVILRQYSCTKDYYHNSGETIDIPLNELIHSIFERGFLTIRPYLRPMSSMTEEEFEKLKEYSGLKYEQLDLASYQNGTYKCLDFYLSEVPSYVVILVFDWLNAHHFDYRGLIEKGLALEAPKGMYNED